MAGEIDRIQVDEIKYSSVRDMIEDGDILLFAGTDSLSWIIRTVTRSNYSHAGIAAWWGTRLMVMEARRIGVRASRLSHVVAGYHGGVQLWKVTPPPGAELPVRLKVTEFAQTELGRNYSVEKVIGYWRRLYSKRLGSDSKLSLPQKAQKNGSPDDFFCSEYVSYAWRQAGLALTDQPDYFTTPEDLATSKYLKLKGALVAE
jgi:hypothetical protein